MYLILVHLAGFEPTTFWAETRRSIQLSYKCVDYRSKSCLKAKLSRSAMLNSTTSFAPANLSMFFTTGKNGSKGLGFTLSEGVKARVSLETAKNSTEVYFNTQRVGISVVEKVIKKISSKKFRVELSSDLPLGAGFGLSAACGLSAGYAVRDLLQLSKTDLQIARFVHQAEVDSGTGLGDVINEYYGGCCLKLQSSRFFKRLNVKLDSQYIYYKVFGAKPTKSLLSDKTKLEKLNQVGADIIREFKQTLQNSEIVALNTVLDLSDRFSFKTGLISEQTQITIDKIKAVGGHATTLLVGNGVVSNTPFDGCLKAKLFDNQNRI
jgi:pantoate kinase